MKVLESPKSFVRGAEVWPVSVEAYHALGEAGLIPENSELLYGAIYCKMSKSPLHSFLITRLMRLLQSILPSDYLLRSEQPITCADSEPEPDIAIVHGQELDYCDDHPRTAELVIEVCVSSHEYDRSKLQAYAAAGVKECWLILGPERQIAVYRQTDNQGIQQNSIIAAPDSVQSVAIPDFALDLSSFFERNS